MRKTSGLFTATALAGALGLAACSGGDEPEVPTADAPPVIDTDGSGTDGSDDAAGEDLDGADDASDQGTDDGDDGPAAEPDGADGPGTGGEGGGDGATDDGATDADDLDDVLTQIPEGGSVNAALAYLEGDTWMAEAITVTEEEFIRMSGDTSAPDPDTETTDPIDAATWESLGAELLDLGLPLAEGFASGPDLSEDSGDGVYYWEIHDESATAVAWSTGDVVLDRAVWEIVVEHAP